ncbi:MAG TPA: helix-turn-helix transcriptional regulator [Nannocystaceae bacterium]|nr:helix-turn-helix transcriptional regulator [Nannocystaceae bacterium]
MVAVKGIEMLPIVTLPRRRNTITMVSSTGLLTTSEVARLLNVHPKHVYRLLRRGIPARKVGGDWRFDREEVLRWAAPSGDVAQVETSRVDGVAPTLLAANGDVAVELLLGAVNEQGPLVGFVQADRDRALELLAAGEVMLAGAHGRAFPTTSAGMRLARIHLVDREVGLVAAHGKPVPQTKRLSQLRFAYRPQSAAVVVHLEHAAREEKLDLSKLLRKAGRLGSHREVVLAVLRGEYDVGLATRAWAEAVGLAFRKLAVESYGLLLRATDLPRPEIVRLCEVAQSRGYLDRIAQIPGYDTTGCGVMRYDPER